MTLTAQEQALINQVVNNAARRSQRTATSSKGGLISFLKVSGLAWLANKLYDFTWGAIRTFLGF